MKKKLLNNLGLKLSSLLLAFIVWMTVVNISNPIIEDSQVVQVDVLNESVLETANLTYEIIGKDTVTVSYQVRTRDRSLMKASDFHAYVDLKDYNVTGAIPVTVEINKDKENLVRGDTITAKPMVIRIKTEELQRKKFDLQLYPQGIQEEGYTLGMVLLSPDYVTVEGPESQIGQINHMGIEVNVDNVNADMHGTAAPVFYDANDNIIPGLEN
jgi:YbbR domain-containing protein